METFDKNSTTLLEQLNQHLGILLNQVKNIGNMLPKLVLIMDEMMLRSENGMWHAKCLDLVEINYSKLPQVSDWLTEKNKEILKLK